MYDLLIIGGGPAGLSAAVYAARKRLNALLISSDIGGQMNWTLNIENYLGYQLVTAQELTAKFKQQVSRFPLEQKIGYKVVEIIRTENGFEANDEMGTRYEGHAVILATGKKPARLNVPGEVELTGKGVSYCGICDGPLFNKQKVAVIGGGNSAVQTALDMVQIAEMVYLVSTTKLTADPILIEKLLNARNLFIFTEHSVEKINGDRLVESIDIKEIRSGKIKQFDVTGVFVEIGLSPNSDLVSRLAALNEIKEVIVDCRGETGIPGLYAAGDVTDVPEKQIVIAAGEGAKAAIQAHRYLQKLITAVPTA
jgi:NADH-dependent peroxiredoxin subunit F